MRQVDLFEWYLDKIFEDGPHVTKAKILDAFHKANPESLSLVESLSNNETTVCSHEFLPVKALVKKCHKCNQINILVL